MVQPSNVASSSVPDLRPRKGLGKILLVLAGLALVAVVIVAIMVFRDGDNPGRAACDHIEEMADEDPVRWDKFVKALERTVEHRAFNSVKRKYVSVEGSTRYERCTDSFRIIRDTITYAKYATLSECVSKATTWAEGSICFEAL